MEQLSAKTMEIVKSTAPAVKANSEKVTTRMYERMFGKFPYAKPLFKNAPKNQPQVLARSIVGYAENIDNLGALDTVLERIAARHVETSILPEHYHWVGESLLGAIKDILGDAITDEVNDAWTQAYWFLANTLIEKEKGLYKSLLTDEKKKIVKDTAPILTEKGEAITTRMYEIMFSNYPDAKKLFANQPENQNQVLAKAIIGYAKNIDNLSALSGAIEKIAVRHVEVNVKAIYYPWVVESLLQAMSDVLGDAATDAVKKAWFAAYWFLADILMKREKELYAQQAA